MKHILITIAAVVLVGCGGPKDIWEAAQQGNIEAVKQHLAAGTDVNMKGDQRRQTPLHDAAASGHMEVAELLITNGANLNAKSVIGETPLDAAVNFKQTEIANLLRKHGGKTGEELKAEDK
mgnify:CR=1 FL=1